VPRPDKRLPPTVLPPVPLPADPSAARIARGHVTPLCSSWPRTVTEVALLLTSELVANAVLHGGSGIEMSVRGDDDLLRVEVADDGPGLPPDPAPSMPSRELESGRGLALLTALADAWGADPRDAHPGKVVWFELQRASRSAEVS
jgi:anti-sigma regulatory factor (Ser/Thr protein kinase)